MNNPVTCCFGYPHKDNKGADPVLCRRLRQDLPCLCGLARPAPTTTPTGRSLPPVHPSFNCMGQVRVPKDLPPGEYTAVLDADYSGLEVRVLANIDDADRSRLAYYLAGPDPWDDWKPSRDIA